MKILYIITQADGGGAQKYVLTLASYFNGAIAAGAESQQLFDDARAAGLDVYRLKHLKRDIHPWHDLLAVLELKRLIKKLQPQIVHLNSTKAGFLGSLSGWLAKHSTYSFSRQEMAYPKVLFTAHGFRFLEPLSAPAKIFYLGIEKFASRFRDHIITVSEADRQAALRYGIIADSKISVIHNGLAPVKFLDREEAKAALGLPSRKMLLGSIANFYKTKGLDILIDALSLLDSKLLESIHLAIIGEGKERISIEKRILEHRLVAKVTLVGNLPRAEKYLKAFDVFLLPSRKEGFPFVLLAAMQAGVPIIASKVGGIPEALGDAGVQVPPQDPRSLANAIMSLLNDVNLARQLAQRAEDRSQLFSQSAMLEKTQAVYQNLL